MFEITSASFVHIASTILHYGEILGWQASFFSIKTHHTDRRSYRLSDPLLGVATGAFAYYIWETDPRNASQRPPGRSLLQVTQRWWNQEKPPFTLYSGPEPLGDRIDRTSATIDQRGAKAV